MAVIMKKSGVSIWAVLAGCSALAFSPLVSHASAKHPAKRTVAKSAKTPIETADDPAAWAAALGNAPQDQDNQRAVARAIQVNSASYQERVAKAQRLREMPPQAKFNVARGMEDTIGNFLSPDYILTYLHVIPGDGDHSLYCGSGVYNGGRDHNVFAFSTAPDGVTDLHITEENFEKAGCAEEDLLVRLR